MWLSTEFLRAHCAGVDSWYCSSTFRDSPENWQSIIIVQSTRRRNLRHLRLCNAFTPQMAELLPITRAAGLCRWRAPAATQFSTSFGHSPLTEMKILVLGVINNATESKSRCYFPLTPSR